MTQSSKNTINRVSQGDIFKNVEYIEYAVEKNGAFEISKIVFPFVIVLTQDCDLQQDFDNRANNNGDCISHDKHLISAIVAPLYNIEHVYLGEHLSELGLTMQRINKDKTQGKFLKQNQLPRYHYLEFENLALIPSSVIDFKHYFSINIEVLLKQSEKIFECKVRPFHREDISHRFASFLSRIGLPN